MARTSLSSAAGGSRLGPFTARGAILLPKGADASIRIDALDVSGTRASGTLRIVTGGFDGRLAIDGGGLTGELLLRPVGTVQRVEGHIAAVNARLGTRGQRPARPARLRRAARRRVRRRIDATATATAFRSGAITLARFAGNLKLTGGNGELRASIAGSRGRSFEIQTVTQIAPDRYSIAAQGTVDRRPLRLLIPGGHHARRRRLAARRRPG